MGNVNFVKWSYRLIGIAAKALLFAGAWSVGTVYAQGPYNWTGYYVGLNAGWVGSANKHISLKGTDTGGGGLGAGLGNGAIPPNIGLPLNGFIGGGQVGVNGQMAGQLVVWGLEADFQGAAGAKDSFSTTVTTSGFAPTTTKASRELDWLGTLRGRVGVTPRERMLLFVTGGLAYGGTELRIAGVGPTWDPPLNTAQTSSRTSVGWTTGGGIEFAVSNNTTVKAEYLYFDLADNHTTIHYTYGSDNTTMTAHSQDRNHSARVGINYKFKLF